MADKDFEIKSSDFKETTRDGIKAYVYSGSDKLEEAKKEIFGEDKIKEYEDIREQFHTQMGNAITELGVEHYSQEGADSEMICSYKAEHTENSLYFKKNDDGLDVTHKVDANVTTMSQVIASNIWDAISDGNNEDEDDED